MTEILEPTESTEQYLERKHGLIAEARTKLAEVQAQMRLLNAEHGDLLNYIYGLQCDIQRADYDS